MNQKLVRNKIEKKINKITSQPQPKTTTTNAYFL